MLGILVISLLFTVIHMQYDWFGLFQVFLIGLLLGWIRWRSGSTLLTMDCMPSSTPRPPLQTIAYIRWFSD